MDKLILQREQRHSMFHQTCLYISVIIILVLGALMIEKDAYSLVSEILRPESFYEHRHQLIYSAITDLAVNQKPVDILTVKEQLAKRGDLEEVGGPFYITQLSSKV